MKKNLKFLFSIAIMTFVFTAVACRFPYKIVRNLPPTPPPTETVTSLPSATIRPTLESTAAVTPEPTAIEIDLVPVSGSVLTWSDYSNFVFIPSGEFILGKDSASQVDFAPAHKVSLEGFWIQQAEVTNQQYAQCVSDGKCSIPEQEAKVPYWYEDAYDGNHPVVGVTWFQASEYCSYIHSRLPTEAEWEAAARGPDAKVYPWGGDKPNCNYLNFGGCLEPAEPYDIKSFSFGASDFGALDMAGNVFEWVGDWYAKDFYQSSPASNPTGPLDGRKRVYRGGSYKSPKDEIGSYLRFATEPENQAPDLGFRCVLLGDPVNDPTLKIGQPCQVVGMNDQKEIQSTPTPFPCSSASVSGFCQLLSGKPSYGVDIRQSGCLGNVLDSMTGNSQPLTCTIIPLSDGGNKYQCTFPGMAQGLNVDVNYCHEVNLPSVDISCPIGYQLNQKSTLCELENAKLPMPPCPQGYVDVPGYGCLPASDPNTSDCPIDYYSVETAISLVCMPLNKCLLSDAPDACNNLTCASSQKFDPSKTCCSSADSPQKICASNQIFNAEQNICLDPEALNRKCLASRVNIPYCPTMTPTTTSTPQSKSITCSDITDATVCIKSGCGWALGLNYCY